MVDDGLATKVFRIQGELQEHRSCNCPDCTGMHPGDSVLVDRIVTVRAAPAGTIGRGAAIMRAFRAELEKSGWESGEWASMTAQMVDTVILDQPT